jgi:hypothetical protein
MSPPPAERRQDPIRAVKAVEVRGPLEAPGVHPVGRYWREPIDHRGTAVARCRKTRAHRAPEFDCSCGFHACADPAALAAATVLHPDVALAEVDLSGRIVEHERGWRAARQRILGLRFPDRCARCGGPAAHVAVETLWQSVCAPCALDAVRRGRPVLRLGEVAGALGVEVRFDAVPVETRRAWRAWRIAASVAFVAALCGVGVLVSRSATSPVVLGLAGMGALAAAAGLIRLWRLPSSREASRWFSLECWAVTAVALGIVLTSLDAFR